VIGIFSKKKRELTFVDIDSIFSINQKIRRVEEHHQANLDNEGKLLENNNINNGTHNYLDNKAQLVKDFGTLKAKKQVASLRNNIVNEENIASLSSMKRILEENAKTQESFITTNIEEQMKNKINDMKEILPDFDAEAKELEKLFNINSSKIIKLNKLI
jgi:hypothetical protein